MTERQPVVDLSEEVTHIGGVFSLHLTLEPVHFVHVFTKQGSIIIRELRISLSNAPFMISSRHEETVWIEQLESEQSKDALNTE